MSHKLTVTAIIALSSLAATAGNVGGVNVIGPTETDRFVTEIGGAQAPKGLEGANIALWQSHGWYFEPKLNRWEWQRARLMHTVEDLYTQSYVMPFLMPMLENAGAYVMSPRERDINTTELIVDNDGGHATGSYSEHNGSHRWSDADGSGFAYRNATLRNDENPFTAGTARQAAATDSEGKASHAVWSADIPEDGEYAVYVSYKSLPNSVNDARYTIRTAAGDRQFAVNQRMGGGTWIYLGHFPLAAGHHEIVKLSNLSSVKDGVVTADAVKIGGGMGNVARIVKEPLDDIDYTYTVSGYPRFTEGARYWLQWAGAPKSVYTPSDNINDYTDDYKCRGEWVNWLAGGSSMLPDRKGLGIPVDLSFAFHTDAGSTRNDSVIGTLGIYFTDKGKAYANGTPRRASRELTDMVMTSIVDDIRAKYEPDWRRRDMRDASYYEARVPEVPAMLLELLSHQNFADMKYGLDPTFRFTVSRAIYKAMLRFIAQRDGREYTVQPLPVRAMAITADGDGRYTLSWQPTDDKTEPTASPTHYIIEERVDRGAFKPIATVNSTSWTTKVSDHKIHSYRVIAANDGGLSFAGETLALCDYGDRQPVVIVNGFTRVSGPDWFDSGDRAGFDARKDAGVPYIRDINYIGEQFEFRRDIPWTDDDACGFGSSRSNYETKVIAGNTSDYAITHGEAIRAAHRGFTSMSVEAFVSQGVSPSTQVVDLILGKQKEIAVGRGVYGTKYKTFTPQLQQRLTEFTSAGGKLLVTGSYIATDLWDNQFSTEAVKKADQDFAANVLGFKWRVGQASITGEAYQVPCRFRQFKGSDKYEFYNTYNSDGYAVESPDSFYPADNATATTFMRYTENNLIAGTALDNGKWRVVAIGFPFESIRHSGERDDLMKQVLAFFDAPAYVSPIKSSPKAPADKGKKNKSKAKNKNKKNKK